MIILVSSWWSPGLFSRSTCSSATFTSLQYSHSSLLRIGMSSSPSSKSSSSSPHHHHQSSPPPPHCQFRCNVPALAHLPVDQRQALAIPRSNQLSSISNVNVNIPRTPSGEFDKCSEFLVDWSQVFVFVFSPDFCLTGCLEVGWPGI